MIKGQFTVKRANVVMDQLKHIDTIVDKKGLSLEVMVAQSVLTKELEDLETRLKNTPMHIEGVKATLDRMAEF